MSREDVELKFHRDKSKEHYTSNNKAGKFCIQRSLGKYWVYIQYFEGRLNGSKTESNC